MMVQVVEDLEREDFRRVAAPIYGRGFIKLYADYLGLDPEPLIQEFMEIYTGSRPPQVMRRTVEGGEAPAAPGASDDVEQAAAGEQTEAPVAAVSAASSPLQEPDLFSVAAGRSAAVRSVAEPARPGDPAPPRVRPAAETAEKTAAPAAAAPTASNMPASRHGATLQYPEQPNNLGKSGAWLPWGLTPLRAGVSAVMALLVLGILAGGLLALRHHHRHHAVRAAGQAAAAAITQRAQPTPEPYFD